MNIKKKITFITPCFCRGVDCSDFAKPEIRAASIRGQLHWWFRALGGSREDENEIFGSVHGGAKASKIVVRVLLDKEPRMVKSPTLPHKFDATRPQGNGPAAVKQAIAPGESFYLLVSSRLSGLDDRLEKAFLRCLDAWLLMGSLGLRATRGGGNFSFEGQPATYKEYAAELNRVTQGTPFKADLSGALQNPHLDKRYILTDTINGENLHNHPLGLVNRGDRKTSPLRFRLVRLSDTDLRVLIGWDSRPGIGCTKQDVLKAKEELIRSPKISSPKMIGRILDTMDFLK